MRWWKRYEPILEAKPVSGAEAIKDLIAKELVELYEGFPPPEGSVVWEDPALEKKFTGRMAELPPLDAALVAMLTRIVSLDLQHETDAVDHLMRNNHHREAARTTAQLDVLLLLWRVVVEHLEQRKEDAQGHLKRADLVDIAGRAEARFRARAMARN